MTCLKYILPVGARVNLIMEMALRTVLTSGIIIAINGMTLIVILH